MWLGIMCQLISIPEHLEKIIYVYQKSVGIVALSYLDLKAVVLSNLVVYLLASCKRIKILGDLEEAIHSYRATVKIYLPGHISRQMLIADLGNALVKRYHRTHVLEDLEGLCVYQKVVQQDVFDQLFRSKILWPEQCVSDII